VQQPWALSLGAGNILKASVAATGPRRPRIFTRPAEGLSPRNVFVNGANKPGGRVRAAEAQVKVF